MNNSAVTIPGTSTAIIPSSLIPGATVSATPHALVIRHCTMYHSHRSPVLEAHHIAPQSWWKAAGLPVDSPLADLCGLCHNNTHAALDAIIRGISTRGLSPHSVALAREGLAIAKEHGLVPKPTL